MICLKNKKYFNNISENLSEDIDNVLKGTYELSQDVKLRNNTPIILVKNGIKDLPMLINQNHLKENILSITKAKKLGIYNKDANYHNLGKKLFLDAINSLDTPLIIMKSISKFGKNTYIIVTDLQNKNREQIIIPIYIEGKGNYNHLRIDTNKVKTVYGKNNIMDFVNRTIKDNISNVIYITEDKKKKQIITSTGLRLSNSSNTAFK